MRTLKRGKKTRHRNYNNLSRNAFVKNTMKNGVVSSIMKGGGASKAPRRVLSIAGVTKGSSSTNGKRTKTRMSLDNAQTAVSSAEKKLKNTQMEMGNAISRALSPDIWSKSGQLDKTQLPYVIRKAIDTDRFSEAVLYQYKDTTESTDKEIGKQSKKVTKRTIQLQDILDKRAGLKKKMENISRSKTLSSKFVNTSVNSQQKQVRRKGIFKSMMNKFKKWFGKGIAKKDSTKKRLSGLSKEIESLNSKVLDIEGEIQRKQAKIEAAEATKQQAQGELAAKLQTEFFAEKLEEAQKNLNSALIKRNIVVNQGGMSGLEGAIENVGKTLQSSIKELGTTLSGKPTKSSLMFLVKLGKINILGNQQLTNHQLKNQ